MAGLGDQPNIVTIYDVGDDDGQPYIVSQYMAGGAVDGLDLPLGAERTLAIAKDVCRGLAHAHAHGVVHRDLKPGNVWLAADGAAEIGDFGLAVALEQSRLTMHGMLVGTVAYMPPEQALGGEVTPRADLYSLGCMLYEMITGRPPFVGDNPSAVISQHINTPPVAPSWHADTCPLDLESLILRLLAKDPARAARQRRRGARDRSSASTPPARRRTHSDSNVLDRLSLGVFVGREQETGAAAQGLRRRGLRPRRAGDARRRARHRQDAHDAGTRDVREDARRARCSGAARTSPPARRPTGRGSRPATSTPPRTSDDLPTLIGPQMTPEAISELTRIFPWLLQGANVTAAARDRRPRGRAVPPVRRLRAVPAGDRRPGAARHRARRPALGRQADAAAAAARRARALPHARADRRQLPRHRHHAPERAFRDAGLPQPRVRLRPHRPARARPRRGRRLHQGARQRRAAPRGARPHLRGDGGQRLLPQRGREPHGAGRHADQDVDLRHRHPGRRARGVGPPAQPPLRGNERTAAGRAPSSAATSPTTR